MANQNLVLVLDAGTTQIKAIVFDDSGNQIALAAQSIDKQFSTPSWVEQDPNRMVEIAKSLLNQVVGENNIDPENISAMGITNQRETIIAWDKNSGRTLYPAIIWEDERTKRQCKELASETAKIRQITGLEISPYFSATKIGWLLDEVEEVKLALKNKTLAVGTVDSWLSWNLLSGEPHVTDRSNAARTLLFNIKTKQWDDVLLELFGITEAILPTVQPSQSLFGYLDSDIVGRSIPVFAVCGDQQSSLFAAMKLDDQSVNATKVTFGTGCFIDQSIGNKFALHPGFQATLGPSANGDIYILEAKIDDCGEKVEPLIGREPELERFVTQLCGQVSEIIKQLPNKPNTIVIDGGVTQYEPLVDILKKSTGITVERQKIYNGTGLGVALLALDGGELS